MTRHLIIFSACFLLAVVATAAVRTVLHDPYDALAAPADAAMSAEDMHAGHGASAAAPPAEDPHAGHAMPQAPANVQPPADVQPPATVPATSLPVNSVCPICGMPVDPKLPTATYQGKTVGFGCRACPPKFAADPDLYGPAALRNQVVEDEP